MHLYSNPTKMLNPYRFATGGGGTDFTANLQHFWDLDGGSGNDTAAFGGVDLTEKGTVGGSSTGAPNSSYGYRSCHNINNAAFSTASTILGSNSNGIIIAFWVRSSSTSGTYAYASANSGGYNYMRRTTGNVGQIALDGSTKNTTTAIYDGSWHSVVVTSSSTNGGTDGDEIFVDGSSETTGTFGYDDYLTTWYVGASFSNNQELTGDICSFGLWDDTADSTWASDWHNGGSNLHYSDF